MTRKMRTGEFTVTERARPKRRWTDETYKKLLRNTAVCAAILFGIAALSGLDGAVAPAARSELVNDKDLGRLQFVYSRPVEGEVIETFADSGQEVVISAEPRAPVSAILAGVVYATDRTTMVVMNDSGTMTTYDGVVPGIKAGDRVEAGEIIGQTASGELSLTTVSGVGYIDSLSPGEPEPA